MTAIRNREWADLLHEQPWPYSQQLTEDQAERIEDLAGSLDLNRIVEDFSDYWAHALTTIAPSRLKTWVLPLRLRTWIRNEKKRSPDEADRSDDFLERYQEEQRRRGNR